MRIKLPVRLFVVAYMVLLCGLMVLSVPVVAVMLLITYIRDGTLELQYPTDTQNG